MAEGDGVHPTGDAAAPDDDMAPGTKVEVRRRLDGQWARGFEIVAPDGAGYTVRRLSDGQELPVPIPAEDLRPQRKKATWWY